MTAFKYFANNDVRKVEVERPEPGSGERLVRVLATGVCGTDLHIDTHDEWIGKAPIPEVTMGHEFVGEVVAVDPDVGFPQKSPQVPARMPMGTRVCAEPHIPCGRCYWCLRGESNTCANIGQLGVSMDGSFAEYMVVPADRCVPVPESMSDEEAAGIEPVACAVRAVRRSRMTVGESVLVIGAGPMGQHVARVAKLTGAGLVVVSEPNASRRDIAAANGADLVLDPAMDGGDAVKVLLRNDSPTRWRSSDALQLRHYYPVSIRAELHLQQPGSSRVRTGQHFQPRVAHPHRCHGHDDLRRRVDQEERRLRPGHDGAREPSRRRSARCSRSRRRAPR